MFAGNTRPGLCPQCGAPFETDSAFCGNCGAQIPPQAGSQLPPGSYAPNPQGNINPQGNVNAPAGNAGYNNFAAPMDGSSVGFNILSFFIPLAGLIIYLTSKDATPIKAKAAGKWAIIGFIIMEVLPILVLVAISLVGVGLYY
jgi:hypothetical protein